MVEQDLPMLADWLREDHVQQWWKDPKAADDAEAHYLPRILGIDPTEMFVIVWEGRDIGMLQRYRLDDYPDWERSLAPSGLSFGIAAGTTMRSACRISWVAASAPLPSRPSASQSSSDTPAAALYILSNSDHQEER